MELDIPILGKLVAFALLLVFEYQADRAQPMFWQVTSLPHQPNNDHPDGCPEAEESGDRWTPAWGRQGRLRHGH